MFDERGGFNLQPVITCLCSSFPPTLPLIVSFLSSWFNSLSPICVLYFRFCFHVNLLSSFYSSTSFLNLSSLIHVFFQFNMLYYRLSILLSISSASNIKVQLDHHFLPPPPLQPLPLSPPSPYPHPLSSPFLPTCSSAPNAPVKVTNRILLCPSPLPPPCQLNSFFPLPLPNRHSQYFPLLLFSYSLTLSFFIEIVLSIRSVKVLLSIYLTTW